jgi:hypothetical protein
VIILIVVWIACAVLNYGICVAYCQRQYPTIAHDHAVNDRVFFAIFSINGPIALIVCGVFIGIWSKFKHGWML